MVCVRCDAVAARLFYKITAPTEGKKQVAECKKPSGEDGS